MIKSVIGLFLVSLLGACQFTVPANEYAAASEFCAEHNGVSHMVVSSGYTNVVCVDGKFANHIGYKK